MYVCTCIFSGQLSTYEHTLLQLLNYSNLQNKKTEGYAGICPLIEFYPPNICNNSRNFPYRISVSNSITELLLAYSFAEHRQRCQETVLTQ